MRGSIVSRVGRSVASAALACLLSGCSGELSKQLQQVRQGKSDSIQLQTHTLTDADVTQLGALPSLRVVQAERSSVTAAGCAELSKLKLHRLTLRGSRLTDKAAKHLAKIKTLRTVNLPQADFTDQGMIALTRLPELELLRIGSPRLSDAAAPAIASMNSLRFLHLINVPLTDEGLKWFESMRQLESLYLDGSQVSQAGLESLIEALPDLHLHIDQQHLDIDPRQGHDE